MVQTPRRESHSSLPGDPTVTETDLQSIGDHVDLLTVVLHEMGHELGLHDIDATLGTLMSNTLTPATRRLPDTQPVATSAADQLFAQLATTAANKDDPLL